MAKKKPGVNGHSNKSAEKKVPTQKKKVATKQLRINRTFPSGQQGMFSNQFAVQHDESAFYLLFFQLHPPLIIGDDEQSHKELAALTEVNAECVARVIVPPQMVPAIIKVLGENFQKREAIASGSVELIDLDKQSSTGT